MNSVVTLKQTKLKEKVQKYTYRELSRPICTIAALVCDRGLRSPKLIASRKLHPLNPENLTRNCIWRVDLERTPLPVREYQLGNELENAIWVDFTYRRALDYSWTVEKLGQVGSFLDHNKLSDQMASKMSNFRRWIHRKDSDATRKCKCKCRDVKGT